MIVCQRGSEIGKVVWLYLMSESSAQGCRHVHADYALCTKKNALMVSTWRLEATVYKRHGTKATRVGSRTEKKLRDDTLKPDLWSAFYADTQSLHRAPLRGLTCTSHIFKLSVENDGEPKETEGLWVVQPMQTPRKSPQTDFSVTITFSFFLKLQCLFLGNFEKNLSKKKSNEQLFIPVYLVGSSMLTLDSWLRHLANPVRPIFQLQ